VLIFDRSAADRLDWWKLAGMEPLHYYCLTDDPNLTPRKLIEQSPRESIEMVEQAIDQMEPPPGGVITIDVANFIAGDANLSYRSGFGHGWALSKIAHQRQVTIFALMHGGKQKAGHQYLRLTDRTIASTGFMGAANAFAYITTREETIAIADPQVMDLGGRADLQIMEWEPRKGSTERFVLGRLASGLFDCLGNQHLTAKREIDPVAQQRLNAILTCFADAGSIEIEGLLIREELDIPKSTFSRAVNLLIDSGRLVEIRRGRKVYYRLIRTTPDS
jgi:hypothetical protein